MTVFEQEYSVFRKEYCAYFRCEKPTDWDEVHSSGRITELMDSTGAAISAYLVEVRAGRRVYLDDLSVAYAKLDFPFLWLLVEAQFSNSQVPQVGPNTLASREVQSFIYQMIEDDLAIKLEHGRGVIMRHNYSLFTELFEIIMCSEERGERYVQIVENLLLFHHPNMFNIQRLAIWNLPFLSEKLISWADSHPNEDIREELSDRIVELGE